MRRLCGILSFLIVVTGCGCARQPTSAPGLARAALDEYVVNFWIKRDTSALGRALAPTMAYHYNSGIIAGGPAAHLKALRSFGGPSRTPQLQLTSLRYQGTWVPPSPAGAGRTREFYPGPLAQARRSVGL